LLEAHDRNASTFASRRDFQQVEIYLAGAQHDARHGRGLDVVDLVDDIMKAAEASSSSRDTDKA